MADESILHKIRALRAKASNAASTEAEVEAAAAAITKLMMKYDIDESDLVERKDALIKSKMQEMGIELRKSRSQGHRVRDDRAGAAGSRAAENVNLNRPFKGTTKERIGG